MESIKTKNKFKKRLSKIQIILPIILVITTIIIIFFISKSQYIIINSEENKILLDKCNKILSQFEKNMDLITISNDEAGVRWYKFKNSSIEDADFYDDLITKLRKVYTIISPKESKIYTDAGLVLKMSDLEKIKKQDFERFIEENYNDYTASSTDFTYISYIKFKNEDIKVALQPIYEYKYIYIDNPDNYTDLLKNEYLKLLILNNITECLKKISI